MRKVRCQNCREKVEKGSRFCPNCGTPLIEGSALAAKERTAVTLLPEDDTQKQPLQETIEEPQPAIGLERIPEESIDAGVQEKEIEGWREGQRTEAEKQQAVEEADSQPEEADAEPNEEKTSEPEQEETEPEPEKPAAKSEMTAPTAEKPEPTLLEEKTEPEKTEEAEETGWANETAKPETAAEELHPGTIIEMPRAEAAQKNEPQPQSETNTPPYSDGEGERRKADKVKKVRTKASFGKVLASVLLSVLAFLLGTCSCLAFFVRNATSEGAVERTVYKINLGRIGAGLFEGGKAEDILLQEYAADRLTTTFIHVRSEDAGKLLNESFVKDFVVSKLNSYVEDIFIVTKDGEIEAQEIIELFDDNWNTVRRDLGQTSNFEDSAFVKSFKDELLEVMEMRLKRDIDFEEITVSAFREDHETAFRVVRTVMSYPAIIVMAVLFMVFIVLLIVMNFRYRGGFRYAGTVLILIGVVDLLVVQAAFVMPVVLNSMLGLGYEFYIAVLSNFIEMPLIIGLGALVLGIVLSLTGKKLRKEYKKKAAAAAKEPLKAA